MTTMVSASILAKVLGLDVFPEDVRVDKAIEQGLLGVVGLDDVGEPLLSMTDLARSRVEVWLRRCLTIVAIARMRS